MHIKNSTFLVTGGGSGLGAGCVRRLRGCGAKVLVADIHPAHGASIANELGENVQFHQTDVTCEGNVASAVDAAVNLSRGSGLRGVINCAGVASADRVLGRDGPHPLDSFSKVVDINLVGSFNTTRLGAAAIEKAEPTTDGERGVIINTASIAAFEGQIGQAAYAASKGGVMSLTLPVARELAGVGVRVMAIAPGLFDTPMMDGFPPKVRQSLEGQLLFPARFGRPEEFATLAQHIIENPMLNGSVIRLDGGVRMAVR